MVRRFVEQQQVRLLHEQSARRGSARITQPPLNSRAFFGEIFFRESRGRLERICFAFASS